MKCFAGIDIGSTNVKILVINEDGAVEYTASSSTPRLIDHGLKCFDIRALDDIIDSFIDEARIRCHGDLVSVSFSSVGETVVPIDPSGRVLAAPVFWDEKNASPTDGEMRIIEDNTCYSIDGVSVNGLMMSLEKILWYEARFREQRLKAASYLPLASYEVYRKTGCGFWDYSLASRSHAYDVFRKEWNHRLLDELGLDEPGEIRPMGTYAGSADGMVYGVGGHDHDIGLFGLYSVLGFESFLFDSMGTSSTVSIITDDVDAIDGNKTFLNSNGGVINGFRDGQFIVFRACSRYGAILSFWMHHFGLEADDCGYAEINERMRSVFDGRFAFLMRCGGNFLSPDILARNEIDIHRLNMSMPAEYFIKSAYAYCAMKTRDIVDNLLTFSTRKDPDYYIGGAAIGNDLFMRYKATVLGRSLKHVPVKEICALGAVCSGIIASGNDAVLSSISDRLSSSETVVPDDSISADAEAAMRYYEGFVY